MGIASVVNRIFTFTSQIISTSALSAEISKCFKLQEQNNLTGNITSSSDTYTFYGSKPSEIGYLSGINLNIQGQLNNITNNYLLSSSATNLHQPKGNYQPLGNYTNIEYVLIHYPVVYIILMLYHAIIIKY